MRTALAVLLLVLLWYAKAEAATVHVVRPGDTLWRIAGMHRVSVADLVRVNRLADADRLRVGQRLLVPPPGRGPAPPRGDVGLRRDAGRLAWPSRGVITSRFGYRWGRHHHGIDISAPVGTPIRAVRDGVVTFAGWRGGYGRLVILDHGQGLATWYGHASKILVRVGQRVTTGQEIAAVGATGNVTGPNLHFEVRINGAPQDPIPYLR